MKRTSIAAILGLALTLAACSSAATADTSTSTTAGQTQTTVAQTESTVPDVGKVSANTASESDIADALAAAGIDNADRWAREVVEYRPYDESDPELAHLRDELAKYNPGDGVIDAIVSVLQP